MDKAILLSRLRMLRAARRLSQLKVEQESRLGRGQYWRIENGYDQATDDELGRIARALSVTLEDLVAPESRSAIGQVS